MRATLRGSSKTASCATQAVQPPARRAQARTEAGHAHSRSRLLCTIKSLLLPAALMATSACASSSYMGISLVPGASDAELQSLASRARAGDKQAQLELGARFEEGRGVPLDMGKAKALYRQAAAHAGGMQMMYIPVKGGMQAVPVWTGKITPGLSRSSARAASGAKLTASSPQALNWPVPQDILKKNCVKQKYKKFKIKWYELEFSEKYNGNKISCENKFFYSRSRCEQIKSKRINYKNVYIKSYGQYDTDLGSGLIAAARR